MVLVCPIDQRCAHQISSLLQPPDPLQVQEYFDKLISQQQCDGIRVQQNGEFGKSVYACTDFEEGELILKDRMLFGMQHLSNKMDCLVCSYCFRFIGSIELQVGRKLYFRSLGVSASSGCDRETSSHSCDTDSTEEEENYRSKHSNISSSGSSNNILPGEAVESLMNGASVLPCSSNFSLPSVVPCCGGCDEAYYCSKLCSEADWESFHSLLCTGENSKSLSTEAVSRFIQHAGETNDIFLLAAKAISFTILRYRKLKATGNNGGEKVPYSSIVSNPSFLLEAWKPISIGYKGSVAGLRKEEHA